MHALARRTAGVQVAPLGRDRTIQMAPPECLYLRAPTIPRQDPSCRCARPRELWAEGQLKPAGQCQDRRAETPCGTVPGSSRRTMIQSLSEWLAAHLASVSRVGT